MENKNPLFFEVGITISGILSQYYSITQLESKIGFIVNYIGIAYNRIENNSKYTCILIFPEGKIISQLLQKDVHSLFGEKILVASVLEYYDEDTIVTN